MLSQSAEGADIRPALCIGASPLGRGASTTLQESIVDPKSPNKLLTCRSDLSKQDSGLFLNVKGDSFFQQVAYQHRYCSVKPIPDGPTPLIIVSYTWPMHSAKIKTLLRISGCRLGIETSNAISVASSMTFMAESTQASANVVISLGNDLASRLTVGAALAQQDT